MIGWVPWPLVTTVARPDGSPASADTDRGSRRARGRMRLATGAVWPRLSLSLLVRVATANRAQRSRESARLRPPALLAAGRGDVRSRRNAESRWAVRVVHGIEVEDGVWNRSCRGAAAAAAGRADRARHSSKACTHNNGSRPGRLELSQAITQCRRPAASTMPAIQTGQSLLRADFDKNGRLFGGKFVRLAARSGRASSVVAPDCGECRPHSADRRDWSPC